MPPPKKAVVSNFTAVLGTDEAKVKEVALALSRELAPADAGDFDFTLAPALPTLTRQRKRRWRPMPAGRWATRSSRRKSSRPRAIS